MRKYITTPKFIKAVPEDITENDAVIVVYKPADTVKVSDIKALTDTDADIIYAEVTDRDDFLIFLGMTIPNGGEFVFLDPALPVPKRFASMITTPSKRTARKKPAPEKEPADQAKTENTAQSETDMENASGSKRRRGRKAVHQAEEGEPDIQLSPIQGIEPGMNKPEGVEPEPADTKENYTGAREAWRKAMAKYGPGTR